MDADPVLGLPTVAACPDVVEAQARHSRVSSHPGLVEGRQRQRLQRWPSSAASWSCNEIGVSLPDTVTVVLFELPSWVASIGNCRPESRQ